MKALLVIWVDRPKNLPEWFQHGKEMDITPEQIMELYNSGSNVMIKHPSLNSIGYDILVAVDNQGFGQR
jgi:hypothetical protein